MSPLPLKQLGSSVLTASEKGCYSGKQSREKILPDFWNFKSLGRPLGKWKRPTERTKHLAEISWVRTKFLTSPTKWAPRIGENQRGEKNCWGLEKRVPDLKGLQRHEQKQPPQTTHYPLTRPCASPMPRRYTSYSVLGRSVKASRWLFSRNNNWLCPRAWLCCCSWT